MEVLIALLLLSVGIFNLAGLQSAAKKANYIVLQRTTALMLARDMAGKLRANRASVSSYLSSPSGVGGGTLSRPAQECIESSSCLGGQMAEHDLWLWERALDGANERRPVLGGDHNTGGLVSPTGCISGPASAATGTYTITIAWRGLSKLTNVSADNCGTGSELYGPNAEYRRLLSFAIFVGP